MFVLGAQKNRLIEKVLLSTHELCFGCEIRNIYSLIMHSYLETSISVKGDKKQLRPNKKKSMFSVTGLEILGRVGTHIFLNYFFSGKNIISAF